MHVVESPFIWLSNGAICLNLTLTGTKLWIKKWRTPVAFRDLVKKIHLLVPQKYYLSKLPGCRQTSNCEIGPRTLPFSQRLYWYCFFYPLNALALVTTQTSPRKCVTCVNKIRSLRNRNFFVVSVRGEDQQQLGAEKGWYSGLQREVYRSRMIAPPGDDPTQTL